MMLLLFQKESAINEILSENIPTNATKHNDNGDLLVSTSTNMVDCDVIGGTQSDNQEATSAEAHMQKLCYLKTKLENLQSILLVRTPNRRAKTTAAQSSSIEHSSTIFVPIAQLKEKP
ncbi:unnamed protein product [Lactuca virosa]|nr:unnamed protein product [Lactuca virosa]